MPGSGLDTMIDLGQNGDLARLYSLFNLVPTGMGVLRKALKDSIAERGRLVNEAEGGGGDEAEGNDAGASTEAPKPRLPRDADMADDALPPPKSAKAKGKERANGAATGPAAPVPQGKKTLDVALKWVQDVLDLKDLFDRLLKVCFADDRHIQAAMNEVCRAYT